MNKINTPKIFFTDLDGTLLTKEKIISPATMSAIEKWVDAGNIFVLCSGRSMDSIKHVKDSLHLNFKNMYLVGYNGGEIYDCTNEKIISRTPLSLEQVTLIMKTAKEQNIYCHTYTDTHIISPADSEELQYYQRAIHSPVIICKDIISALDHEPCKCIAIDIHNKENLERFRKTLHSLSGDKLNLLYSNDKYLEIFPAISGKGAAVIHLSELLNIPLSNTFAAGDEANDISMLQTAEVGIAMANARDEIKKVADITTEYDNNHDGLAPILLSYL